MLPFLRKRRLVLCWLGLITFTLLFAFWPAKYFDDPTLVATKPLEDSNLLGPNNGTFLVKWMWEIYYKLRPPPARIPIWSFHPSPTQRCLIHGLLTQCHEVSGIQFFIDKNVAAGTIPFGTTNALSGPLWVTAFTNALQNEIAEWFDMKTTNFRKGNLVFVQAGPRSILVLPKERVSSFQPGR